MCGRMANTLPPDSVARLFNAVPANSLPPVPDFNICPTQSVAVITADPERRFRPMRWGFLHLGRFSRDYRRLFGECPRDTLSQVR